MSTWMLSELHLVGCEEVSQRVPCVSQGKVYSKLRSVCARLREV